MKRKKKQADAILLFCLSLFCIQLLSACHSSAIITMDETALKQLTNEQIIGFNQHSCQWQDKHNIILQQDHPLSTQLTNLVAAFPDEVNNKKINYHIYLNSQPGAWSSLDGCIRVNSSLLKTLNNNEIQAVIAHEIGHIALHHSIIAFRHAKSAEINQYDEITLILPLSLSQQQELEADEYALWLLKQHHINTEGLMTMLDKLDAYQKQHSNSHPNITARKENLINKNIKSPLFL